MSSTTPAFTVSEESQRKRGRNIIYGAGLSLLLALLVTWGHLRYPETYNDVLLWSVIGFVVLANLINYVRHRRYLRLARDHRVEVHPGSIRFHAAGEFSELDIKDIAAVNLYSGKKGLRHIQIRLNNNRGIRLEDYADMNGLAAALTEQVPKAHVTDRRV